LEACFLIASIQIKIIETFSLIEHFWWFQTKITRHAPPATETQFVERERVFKIKYCVSKIKMEIYYIPCFYNYNGNCYFDTNTNLLHLFINKLLDFEIKT
jgi:hypothetical protein